MIRIAIPTNNPPAVENYVYAIDHSGARGETGREFSPDEYDGLLLPGGVDINPALYGKTRIPQEKIDDDADSLQIETLNRFLEAKKPVLGICRGLQLLNVVFGGTLIQNLPGAENHMSLPSGEDNAHAVRIEPDTFLYPVYGAECRVNSSHHQGAGVLGKGFHAVMRSEDGVIEAIEHDSQPVWAVQWHPERMCFLHRRDDTADGGAIFRFFLDQCMKYRQK